MTQNEKDILLKDLCGRLPYGVKAYVKHWSKLDQKYYEDIYDVKSVFPSLNEVHVQTKRGSVDVLLGYSDYEIKPYLFPLSSMTEEQKKEYCSLVWFDGLSDGWNRDDAVILNEVEMLIDFYHKNHLDWMGLIEKELANDATGLNIY